MAEKSVPLSWEAPHTSGKTGNPPLMEVLIETYRGQEKEKYLVALAMNRGPYDLLIRFRPRNKPLPEEFEVFSSEVMFGERTGFMEKAPGKDTYVCYPLKPWPWDNNEDPLPGADHLARAVVKTEEVDMFGGDEEELKFVPGTPGED
ncbi:hypothetical protein NLI96_g12667 [Meripilus lineatus]|uniref:Uncharacterized protein n=1 Tax=Meripilus lineatus TaxID=2056292 RepID=A0AAD5Y7Z8_9APHY|nr:hypothetical protein NLI96_g12667 [Physisporinus lineatus]